MVGFYDLPTATRLLLYGFFTGALYQFLSASLILDPLWAGRLFPLLPTLIVSLSLSLLTMFLLTRESVRRLNGQPTAGWTFGLGIGPMLVVLLVYRLITTTGAGFAVSGSDGRPFLLVSLSQPWCHGPWPSSGRGKVGMHFKADVSNPHSRRCSCIPPFSSSSHSGSHIQSHCSGFQPSLCGGRDKRTPYGSHLVFHHA